MKICRNCHKAWDGEASVQPDSAYFWANFRKAQLTWCGVCVRKMLNEFELQFKRVLRIEGRK